MSVATSAFDGGAAGRARGLAVVLALTAFAMLAHEAERTQPFVSERDGAAQSLAIPHREVSSPSGSSRRAHERYALPGGGSYAAADARPSLVLLVRIDGAVRVAGKWFGDREIENLFHAAFAHDKATQIVIKAHRGVAHRRVVDLLERAKQSGLTRFAIGTTDDI